ncbi:hypothetical protein [Enterococcus faecalis]|uniref:Phage protein n=1 Tax=Enterococcus faecalis RP2S-4 TaxID=1244145 RepID=A0ABC9TGG8_ENTFL|nr:hypothetical protein [Enterococcus faecalis]EPI04837.1 hypothetical protein D358_02771 [Enterococcus faecalis RP2S-4]
MKRVVKSGHYDFENKESNLEIKIIGNKENESDAELQIRAILSMLETLDVKDFATLESYNDSCKKLEKAVKLFTQS